MKHLYIIGNGFDRHHGMETSYSHFRNWLEDRNLSVLCTIDELFGYCDDDRWQYFESNLATAVTSEIVQEEVRENYPDFGSDDFRDRDWHVAKYAVENKKIELMPPTQSYQMYLEPLLMIVVMRHGQTAFKNFIIH